MQSQKNNTTCFRTYLYSADTQLASLHQFPVTMSKVTCFILWAYTGTGLSHSQHRKNWGGVLEKYAVEWAGRVEISKEEIPVSNRSTHGYIGTRSRLKGENL